MGHGQEDGPPNLVPPVSGTRGEGRRDHWRKPLPDRRWTTTGVTWRLPGKDLRLFLLTLERSFTRTTVLTLGEMKVYLSSTFKDLEDHRRHAYQAMRSLGLDVVAMEDYVARDERPVEQCLADVEAADLYVGVFAFRYGYVPVISNPEGHSVTELEYLHAVQNNVPRLVFLAKPDQWPAQLTDALTREGGNGDLIEKLRGQLAVDNLVNWFTTPDQLEAAISKSVSAWLLKSDAARTKPSAEQPSAAGAENSLFALAGRAQQRWQDALAVLRDSARAMDRIEHRGVAPPGIDNWEYVDQQAVHRRLAASVAELAVELESQSARVAEMVKEAISHVEQVREAGFVKLPGRLAPLIKSLSDLERMAGDLLARLKRSLYDLENRECPEYDTPCETLSRARGLIEDTSRQTASVMEALKRMQAGSSPRTAPGAQSTAQHADRGTVTSNLIWTTRTDAREVPLGGKAAAGTGTLPAAVDAGSVWVPPRYARADKAFTVQVEGDSMIGDGLQDGDFVVVDPSQEEKAGDIVVVLVGNQDDVKSLVKRLWYEGPTIRLDSSNPDYPPVTLGPDDNPQIAGKVTGIFRPVEKMSLAG
jgi:SOS-response transcriptional repressor LexA